ncbi:uncharacterized protein JCM15063_006238 [Sporobolomyces koalae]|uniref:uncharacterized protein n=1 Tax=Sporobolomyces koalae TaxID=500713 RepID=UPI00316DF390
MLPSIVLLTFVACAFASPLDQLPFHVPARDRIDPTSNSTRLVPLSLGAMSKCPDAEICETLIDRVLDTRIDKTGGKRVVGDLVNLELIYLAKENATARKEERTYGDLVCLHGPSECHGNVQQLCAAAHWSSKSPASANGEIELETTAKKAHGEWKDWWNFVQCMNYGKRDKIGDLSTARTCAKVVGREWTTAMEECAQDSSDSQGARLFKKSVARSNKLAIEKSCTIMINERKVCVHDGVWKDCSIGHEVGDFVAEIKREYSRHNPTFTLE